MGRSSRRILGLGAFLAATTCLTGVAFAQSVGKPSVHSSVDDNGVDLGNGTFHINQASIAVGRPSAGGLAFGETYDSSTHGWRTNYDGAINSSSAGSTANGTVLTVSFGGTSETFTISGGVYVPNQGQGSTLTLTGSTYTYTGADGTVANFSTALAANAGIVVANEARLTAIAKPNGEQLTFTYTYVPSGSSGSPVPWYRLQAVTNNLGYQIHLQYDDSGGAYSTSQHVLTKVTALNTAVDYCDPTTNACTGLTQTWPKLDFGVGTDTSHGSSPLTVTDVLGHMNTYWDNGSVFTIKTPSGIITQYEYDSSSNLTTGVVNVASRWGYAWVGDYGADTLVLTITDPLAHHRTVTSTLSTGLVSTDQDALGRSVSLNYDATQRVSQVTNAEGDSIQYTYDLRGNVTQTTYAPKTGSSLSSVNTTANFDSTCLNRVKCNKPNYIVDELGNRTDFTYDATSGLLLTATLPAPTSGGVRPQGRYTYSALNAHYKNSAGSIVSSSTSVSELTGISTCATTTSCAGGADEIKTSITYGSATSSVANSLLPTASSTGSGDGALTVTTTLTYDSVGNLNTADGPLSGTGDTATFRYGADRKLSGVTGPDPDGSGALKNRAFRYTYDSDGRVTLVERGTVNSASDTDWAGFTTINQTANAYDTVGRLSKTTITAGGTTTNVVQQSYDAANRPDCTAFRMNPSVFGSPPTSACTLGTTGSAGPDRIVKRGYDIANQPTKVTSGYGTSLQRVLSV